nr:FkbM family methyltransferase [uncultured Lichenicoccus sp.]
MSDWIVMERIFFDQEYDPIAVAHDARMDELRERILSEGKQPLIIDCGANIGLSAIWLSQRFAGSKVIAIEPEPANFELLKLNAGNFPNIVPVCAAISDRTHLVSLSNRNGSPWSWETEESETGTLQTVTIKQIRDSYRGSVLLVVKVDIEGFETSLFRNDVTWTEDVPLLIFEMHDWLNPWSGSGHAFFSSLTKSRRDYLVQGENVFSYAHREMETQSRT